MSPPVRRALRRAVRGLGAAVLVAYAVALACLLPLFGRGGRDAVLRHWSSCALRVLHVRVHAPSVAIDMGSGVLLANHVSWLDIIVLLALIPGRFVAKDEVRGWPLIGWLTRRTGTLFVRRDRRSDAARVNSELLDVIAGGERVFIFPEGTTTEGREVLPFRTALLEAAVQAGAAVHPLALRYHRADGCLDTVAAYIGDCSLGESLWNILGAPELNVSVAACAPLPAAAHTRRTLAAAAHAEVAAMLRRMEYEPTQVGGRDMPVVARSSAA